MASSCVTSDKYYCGISCDETSKIDYMNFRELIDAISEGYDPHYYDVNDNDHYSDCDEISLNIHSCKKNYTLHKIPDFNADECDSYLGTVSESDFAFDDLDDQTPFNDTSSEEYVYGEVAPEDINDMKSRARGSHVKSKIKNTLVYVGTNENNDGFNDLLPGKIRYNTL